MQEPLSIVALPGGEACLFYGSAYLRAAAAVSPVSRARCCTSSCRSRGDERLRLAYRGGGGLRVIDLRASFARRSRSPEPTAGCSSTSMGSIRSPGGSSASERDEHPPAVRAAARQTASRWRWRTRSSSRVSRLSRPDHSVRPLERAPRGAGARWWRAARWRWRSRPRMRCHISTGFPTAWWSCCAGWAPRWFRRDRWSPASPPAGAFRGAEDHRAAAEILASVARDDAGGARCRRPEGGLTESALQAQSGGRGRGARAGLRRAADRGVRRQLGQTRTTSRTRAGRHAPAGRRGAARPLGRSESHDGFRRSDLDRASPAAGRRSGWSGSGDVVRQARDAAVGAVLRPRQPSSARSRDTRPTARLARWSRPRDSAMPSCTAPATRSIAICTARGRTSTTTRPTTTGCWCPGVGFSVEPGIYLPGEFGVRSEVNMFWGEPGPGGDADASRRWS